MKFYVYCLAENLGELEEGLVGVEEHEVELLAIEGLAVVASEVENEFIPVSRENILRHESVVRRVLAETTPLPFRFGTLVVEASLQSYLKSRHSALLERLAAVRDCVEMSIKIIWQNWSEQERIKAEPQVTSNELGAGAAFLTSKRQEMFGDEKLNKEARDIADWLKIRLGGMVRHEEVAIQPKQKLVIAGTYLVERAFEADYRSELAKLKAERPELHFLTSGPWPPYTFANIDLEFETHFGVS